MWEVLLTNLIPAPKSAVMVLCHFPDQATTTATMVTTRTVTDALLTVKLRPTISAQAAPQRPVTSASKSAVMVLTSKPTPAMMEILLTEMAAVQPARSSSATPALVERLLALTSALTNAEMVLL